MKNKEIIEKVLEPYGIIKDGRVIRVCMMKALAEKEKQFEDFIEELKREFDDYFDGSTPQQQIFRRKIDNLYKKYKNEK